MWNCYVGEGYVNYNWRCYKQAHQFSTTNIISYVDFKHYKNS